MDKELMILLKGLTMKNKIWELINNSNSILLLTHENPDGDAIGCTLAFYQMLCRINKDVDAVLPKFPTLFNFLPSINNVVDRGAKNYDLVITLDCSSKERIGQINDEFNRGGKSVNIDHHVSNTEYADINYVLGNEPACSQIVYYLFKEWNIFIDNTIGLPLVTGLLTDTGGFRNNNVNKDTYRMVQELMDVVNVYELYDRVLVRKSIAQFELIKLTMNRLEFFCNGKIAFSYITKEDMTNVSAKFGDHEGLVDIGRNISLVEVSIFMREDQGYHVSFRSNGKVKVNEIAMLFGGNGHMVAAGALINMSFDEAKSRLIKETEKVINLL